MTDKARELLADEYEKEPYGGVMAALLRSADEALWLKEVPAIRAVRAALRTAPEGWVMVRTADVLAMAERWATDRSYNGSPADDLRAMLAAAQK